MRCADMLMQDGFQVTVIEGRQRLGGRLHQERLPNGHLVDMGPNWIHGTKDNPILDLAKETETTVATWDAISCVINEDGKLLPPEDGERYATIMWGIVEDAFAYSNKHSNDIDPLKNLRGFFERRIVEVIPDSVEGFENQRKTVLQIAELWGSFVGSPIQRQSLKFFWLEECIEGGECYSDTPETRNGTLVDTTLQRISSARGLTAKSSKR